MKRERLIFKIIFSIVFGVLVFVYIFFDWFRERIDATSISLLLIGFIPWLLKYIKSLEVFGIKAELVTDLEKKEIEKNINKIRINKNKDLIKEKQSISVVEDINSIYENNDLLVKLFLIRYHIDKRLEQLCKNNDIEYCPNIKIITHILESNEILKEYDVNLLIKLYPVLSKAIHFDNSVYDEDLNWIIDNSIMLLFRLDMLVNK